jgi:hypothetical protein
VREVDSPLSTLCVHSMRLTGDLVREIYEIYDVSVECRGTDKVTLWGGGEGLRGGNKWQGGVGGGGEGSGRVGGGGRKASGQGISEFKDKGGTGTSGSEWRVWWWGWWGQWVGPGRGGLTGWGDG